ncbi:hypothetical protein DdX_16022 [Ditylenchus destructor]|uniref:Uncharacterized protein n=1 Tax=Ditylenchus destructor TaxID=166010 RepID=A0AAD4R0E5_9BILA|nr:hypothetical protein DdX_16022 [Ditylenchus destructor]
MNFLFLIFLVNFAATEYVMASTIDDAEAIVSAFKDITDPTADILAKMSKVGKEVAPFIKTVFPLGGLLTAAIKVGAQTESDEYRALVLLSKQMTQQFSKIENKIDFAVKVISLDTKIWDYNREIRDILDVLKSEIAFIWNPALNKTPAVVDGFVHVCRQKNPKHLVQKIHGMTVRDCSKPQSEAMMLREAELYSQIRQTFKIIEHRSVLRMKFTSEYQRIEYENNKLDIITTLLSNETMTQDLIKDIEQAFHTKVSTLNDVVTVVKRALKKRDVTVAPTGCFTHALILGTNYHFAPVAEFYQMIIDDLSRAALYAAGCSDLMFEGNQHAVNIYQESISVLMEETLQFTSKYVTMKLNSSWPSAHKQQIKEALGDATVPETQFKDKVGVLTKMMEQIGLPIYHFQLVMANYEDIGIGLYIEGDATSIFNMTDVGGVDLIVTRYPKDEEYRSISAQKWLDTVRSKIYNTIDENYNAEQLGSDLIPKIKTAIGTGLINSTLYSSLAIVRDYSIIQGGCRVKHESNPTFLRDWRGKQFAKSMDIIEYYWRGAPPPLFRDCEHFVLFLFL